MINPLYLQGVVLFSRRMLICQTGDEAMFSTYLKPGERVDWLGQPKQGLLIRDADMTAIPMSIMLLGFALLLDCLALRHTAAWPIVFFAVTSSAAFLHLGVIRFFTAAHRRRHIYYCLTN